MKETLRMWQLVCYFNDNQLNFIDWDNRNLDRKFNNTGEPVPQYIQEFTNVLMQTRDPRVYRSVLAAQFGAERHRKKYPPTKEFISEWNKLGEVEKKKSQDLIKSYAADAQLRINSCINAGFIEEDKENTNLVYFPLKGKRFATLDGFILEQLKHIKPFLIIIGIVIAWAIRELVPIITKIKW